MLITFTAVDNKWDSKVDSRFGRAKYLLTYNDETEEVHVFDNTENAKEEHGAGPKTAQSLVQIKSNVLITGNGPGKNAATVLKTSNIKIFIGAGEMTIKEAYGLYINNGLKEFC